MSNLFDAVRRHGGEILDIATPLIDLPSAPEAPPEEAVPERAPEAREPEVREEPAFRTVRVRVAGPILPFDGVDRRAAEQYRIMRTRLLHDARQPRVIVVSSAGVAEGKTVTAINLAGALSLKADSPILLIDGDLRRSSLHANLGIAVSPGLMEVMMGACELDRAVVRVAQLPNLYVLPAGAWNENPTELLDSSRWKSLVDVCRERFQYVVLDSPPIGAVADYDLLQAVCDGVVLVARPDHTRRKALFKAIQSVPVRKRLGVVMNSVGRWFLSRARYDYPYRYPAEEPRVVKGGERNPG